jgi:hypothetical protein
MMTVTSPSKRKIPTSKRSTDIARGFDHYHRIACKLAKKQFIIWFPTHDDLVQAASLAATEALVLLGEETTFKQLCRTLRPVLYRQAVAYGLRSTTNRKAGTHKQLRREVCLCQLVLEENELYQLEYHRKAIGVGHPDGGKATSPGSQSD